MTGRAGSRWRVSLPVAFLPLLLLLPPSPGAAAQSPAPPGWVRAGGAVDGGPGAAVAGDWASCEARARRAAMQAAREWLAGRLEAAALEELPGALRGRACRRRLEAVVEEAFLAQDLPGAAVAREFLEVRGFSIGPMARLHVLLDPAAPPVARARQAAASAARAAALEAAARLGALAALAAALALGAWLLDHATRGYFTGRILAAALALGGGAWWCLWPA